MNSLFDSNKRRISTKGWFGACLHQITAWHSFNKELIGRLVNAEISKNLHLKNPQASLTSPLWVIDSKTICLCTAWHDETKEKSNFWKW